MVYNGVQQNKTVSICSEGGDAKVKVAWRYRCPVFFFFFFFFFTNFSFELEWWELIGSRQTSPVLSALTWQTSRLWNIHNCSLFSLHVDVPVALLRRLLMSTQLRRLREHLLTFLALKWLFPGVRSNVIVQCRGTSEWAPAKAAFEWLLVDMNDNVFSQLGRPWERWRTVTAVVWAIWRLKQRSFISHYSSC